ncbi:MAG TPA: efflux RND transporter periplasmic adaptor subunit, partial [Paracoccaceae bacterium]|nr:efflux RND transporter periplasmic adaptor subunit [Paracoccaceae bacterium]
ARARLRRAERSVELARNQLAYATLRADADGVIMETLAEPGQVLTAGQAVVRLARAGEKEAVVAVPEAMLGTLREAAATVELWSEPGHQIQAALRELSPVADPATRTFEARFAMPDAGEDAALGMSVTVTLSMKGSGEVARLPLSALFDDGGGTVVWVVGPDGRLERRAVRVEAYDAGSVRIASGLAAGEKVVTLGVHKLQPGDIVEPIEPKG